MASQLLDQAANLRWSSLSHATEAPHLRHASQQNPGRWTHSLGNLPSLSTVANHARFSSKGADRGADCGVVPEASAGGAARSSVADECSR